MSDVHPPSCVHEGAKEARRESQDCFGNHFRVVSEVSGSVKWYRNVKSHLGKRGV